MSPTPRVSNFTSRINNNHVKMSLKYGLNTKKAAPVRRTILDDDDEDDGVDVQKGAGEEAAIEEISTFGGNEAKSQPVRKSKPTTPAAPPPPRKKVQEDRQDLSSAQASKQQVEAAQDVDASIFDYDSFHDAKSTVSEAKKEADRQDAIARKPKYVNNLLDAAARRKQGQMVAKEKMLQKERENEGDEFQDKEKFVTGAYKVQQEEARKAEAEEKARVEAEEQRRRKAGGGMQEFYRGMMDQREVQHREAMEAAEKVEKEGGAAAAGEGRQKSDAELAAEMRARGVNVHLNEDGQFTDKRELLTAGLNIGSTGKSKSGQGADHLKASNRPALTGAFQRNDGGKQAQRERQTKMMEEQLEAQAKRAMEEEDEERQKMEKAAKSTKTHGDVSDAKARYLARKAAKEKGEG